MHKKESKFTTIDACIVILCFAGACFSGAAFWGEYTHTLVKLDEAPVGTIIFKKRVAQRRFVDRNVWDRLKQASLIYNGDMIRTTEQAEAMVIFQDEATQLSMDENTMIQIYFDNQEGARIDFSGGSLEVASEHKNIVINSGSSTIVVAGQARMEKSEEGFLLSVGEGQASFDGTEVEAGGILALDPNGERNTNPIIAMASFGSSAYVLGIPSATVPVDFSWNSFLFNPDTYVIVEVAADRRFDVMVETRDVYATHGDGLSSVSIPLENGDYWWRVFPANGGSREPANRLYPSGKLQVIPVAEAVLLSPPHEAELVFPAETLVPLSWSAVENASAYLVAISAHADMSHPAVSRRVEENAVTQTGLDYGRLYWRITPVFPPQFRGTAAPSATGAFSVIRGSPILAAPVLASPVQGSTIYLTWSYDPHAASWLVEMADNPAMTNPAVRQQTSSNYFSLAPELLQAGKTWHWRVTARGGAHEAVSAVWKFEVTGNKPAAETALSAAQPEVQSTAEPPALPPDPAPVPPPVPPPALPPAQPEIPHLSPIYFGTDAGSWNEDEVAAANRLLRIVRLLDSSTYRVRVEGHANPTVNPDDIEGRQREQALELLPISGMRAQAIVDELVKLGADPGRLEVRSRGGEHPVAAWEDHDNWWKNRRVEFTVVE